MSGGFQIYLGKKMVCGSSTSSSGRAPKVGSEDADSQWVAGLEKSDVGL